MARSGIKSDTTFNFLATLMKKKNVERLRDISFVRQSVKYTLGNHYVHMPNACSS